ncbi:MAG TPA: alpha/beta hydrolase [Plantibacter sp.]|uniref:alpha/beta fold hydrolase n=1 Tax=unclassified Plantibacter TaxID=2624265 RepID=UPI002C03D964|nr:alpha/beta hydrolase [Plantibacter sp.]
MTSFTSHDGTRLHVDLRGDDSLPDLVVLAGGPARHPVYLGDLGGLSSRRRLVILHQRGVGESDEGATEAAASWPALAEDVESLRQWLGSERIELLAHSAGTRVAISYAARYPQRLDRLCLVTPPATWLVDADDDSAGIIARHAGEDWYQGFLEAVPALLAAPDSASGNRQFPFVAPIAWARWDDTAREHERLGAWHPAAQDAFVHAPSIDEVEDIRDALRMLTAPVLVIAGAEDGLTGLAPVVDLARRFPLGQAVVLDGCGHYPWVEAPASFAAAVTPFFPAS